MLIKPICWIKDQIEWLKSFWQQSDGKASISSILKFMVILAWCNSYIKATANMKSDGIPAISWEWIIFLSAISVDVVSNPDLVITNYPILSAGWFWNNKNLNAIADKGLTDDVIKDITRKVNGGYNGLNERIEILNNLSNINGAIGQSLRPVSSLYLLTSLAVFLFVYPASIEKISL